MLQLGRDNYISFVEKTHQYFDPEGTEYISVSKVLSKIKEPFDAEKMALMKAKGDVNQQKKILAEWEKTKDSSIAKGNFIHNGLEDYYNNGYHIDERIETLGKTIHRRWFKDYAKQYNELMLYNPQFKVAGTADLVFERQRSKNSVIDIGDYKTNESKGIVFDSTSIKDGLKKHYNRYLIGPFEHIEESNYFIYSMQLSIYAYFIETVYHRKIGKLFIIFIDNQLRPIYIPINYMKYEVIALLQWYRNSDFNLLTTDVEEEDIFADTFTKKKK